MATDETYMACDYTKYGLDVYDVNCDLGQRVHEDISAFRDQRTNVSYDSSPGVKRKSKKLAALSSFIKSQHDPSLFNKQLSFRRHVQ
ncbi:hypothetical protein HOLleu_29344 [Holothuria leucospilota]|uniref:Uncharacterized protein n=1 Tax=Holothuria leucospilota TaxID=206669 RepID=A0A9Q1BNB6_HOLLE|nr:hypothetical protein HOLleu_29344 [Holothuria leucospilota]